MSGKAARQHKPETQIDDPEVWDEASAEDVMPRPSGMTVFSLRLPADEFAFIKREADARATTMSELTRNALRYYLFPRASGSLSATSTHKLQVTTTTLAWRGGVAEPGAAVAGDWPASPLGNVDPRASSAGAST